MAVDSTPPSLSDLDCPPDLSDGIIETIQFEYWNPTAVPQDTKRCQHCDAVIPLCEEHVLVMLRVFDGIGSGRYLRPRFCDRSCWVGWVNSPGATASEVE